MKGNGGKNKKLMIRHEKRGGIKNEDVKGKS